MIRRVAFCLAVVPWSLFWMFTWEIPVLTYAALMWLIQGPDGQRTTDLMMRASWWVDPLYGLVRDGASENPR
jgi:hypothetical protein